MAFQSFKVGKRFLHFSDAIASGKVELVAEGWRVPEVVDVLDGEVVRILNDVTSGSAESRRRSRSLYIVNGLCFVV